MLAGNRELIAGLHHDEQFGMTVMLGVGGVLAEAVADVCFRLVPIERLDAEEMIDDLRSEEHTSELQSLMRISYAVFCLKKKKLVAPQFVSPHYTRPLPA